MARLSKRAVVVASSDNHLGDVSSGVVVHETADIARSPSCVICPQRDGSTASSCASREDALRSRRANLLAVGSGVCSVALNV